MLLCFFLSLLLHKSSPECESAACAYFSRCTRLCAVKILYMMAESHVLTTEYLQKRHSDTRPVFLPRSTCTAMTCAHSVLLTPHQLTFAAFRSAMSSKYDMYCPPSDNDSTSQPSATASSMAAVRSDTTPTPWPFTSHSTL